MPARGDAAAEVLRELEAKEAGPGPGQPRLQGPSPGAHRQPGGGPRRAAARQRRCSSSASTGRSTSQTGQFGAARWAGLLLVGFERAGAGRSRAGGRHGPAAAGPAAGHRCGGRGRRPPAALRPAARALGQPDRPARAALPRPRRPARPGALRRAAPAGRAPLARAPGPAACCRPAATCCAPAPDQPGQRPARPRRHRFRRRAGASPRWPVPARRRTRSGHHERRSAAAARTRTREAIGGFTPLPASAAEIEEVARWYRRGRQDEPVELWQGAEASEGRLKALRPAPGAAPRHPRLLPRPGRTPPTGRCCCPASPWPAPTGGRQPGGEDGVLYAIEAQA